MEEQFQKCHIRGASRTEQTGYMGSKCCNFWLLYPITTKFDPDPAHM